MKADPTKLPTSMSSFKKDKITKKVSETFSALKAQGNQMKGVDTHALATLVEHASPLAEHASSQVSQKTTVVDSAIATASERTTVPPIPTVASSSYLSRNQSSVKSVKRRIKIPNLTIDSSSTDRERGRSPLIKSPFSETLVTGTQSPFSETLVTSTPRTLASHTKFLFPKGMQQTSGDADTGPLGRHSSEV